MKVLLKGIGIRSRGPSRRGVLDVFFAERIHIGIQITWRKALRSDWREAERRCLRVQELATGDPTSHITMLDTFNELLLICLCRQHTATAAAFTKAAGKNAQPDVGSWLWNPSLASLLPKGSKWYREIHNARVAGDLAHPKTKKGHHTQALSPQDRDRLLRGARAAWVELISEWKTIL